jgi:type IV pilus assembly protein PilB
MPALVKQAALSDVLLRRGVLSRAKLAPYLLNLPHEPPRLGEALLADSLITDVQLAESLAEQYGFPYRDLTDFRVDFESVPDIPPEWMSRYGFAPLNVEDGFLTVAISDPGDLPVLDRIELLLRRPIRFVISTKAAIEEAVRASERSTHAIAKLQNEFRPILVHENEQGDEELSLEKINKDQSPVVRLVDTIVLNALQKGASDIHIEPTDGTTEIRYRIDGVLYPAMEPLDGRFHNPLVSRIKVMSELDIAERRTPQDGRFKLRIEHRTVDFRVSILPSAFGESVVIRILAKEGFKSVHGGLNLDVLGIKQEDLTRFRRASTASYGMVLVTGPTGSGKTTTLYATISEVLTKEDKIITIEDPVEYQLKGVIQIPVNEKKGLTFARGLRSILRHDPDKIMVGEIRDAETAQIAIQSALTGHLVFSTVHANNAFDVIGRFVNMGIEPYNFVSALNCIMAQRLIRRTCQHCKVGRKLTREECEQLGFDFQVFEDRLVYEGRGCAHCQGLGYSGRHAITEFLALTDTIKELILDRRPASEIRRAAIDNGMTTLRDAGIEKILNGETTLREVNRMTFTGVQS